MSPTQLGVRAFDDARPNQVASANVTITVNRNPSVPVFANLRQVINIPETQPLGETIASVLATDADGVSCCSLLGFSFPYSVTNPSSGVRVSLAA